MQRAELQNYLDALLETARFRDYCPNGLQVEGREAVKTIVTGVTASQALLDAAIAADADAVIVHHGYFWRGEDGRVTGIRKARLATLLRHDINRGCPISPPAITPPSVTACGHWVSIWRSISA